MRGLLLATLILLTGSTAISQARTELWIDNKVLTIPPEETISTTSIAHFINTNFSTERDKLRAIYTWVTYNIRYDKDSMNAINLNPDPQTKIIAALRRRKGVCENYADIFHDIAVKSGLTIYIVSGYTKQWGALDRSGHSWCAVQLGNEWLLCDPTWDEGRRSYNYYLSTPEQMIVSHMPFDPLWQLLSSPLTHDDFQMGRTPKKNDPKQVTDSMIAFRNMSDPEQLESCARRMRQAGIFNDLTRNRLAYIDMQVSIVYEDRDMKLYNASVSDLNRALVAYNEYIQFRNNQFLPSTPGRRVSDMLLPVEKSLKDAQEKLDSLNLSRYNSQYDPSVLLNRIETLSGKLLEQREFLKKWLASNTVEREKLFH